MGNNRLARKLFKIVDAKIQDSDILFHHSNKKLAVALKIHLPGKLFAMILEDHYKIK